MKTGVAFLAIVLGLASPLSHGADCVVENDAIEIVGELSRETFAGPPNYESVHRGDKAETHWILTVRQPIALCTIAPTNGQSYTVGRLSRFQLVLRNEQPGLDQALIARYAVVRGRVFLGRTGQDHTGALIDVVELHPATR